MNLDDGMVSKLEKLLELVPRDWDLGELVADEHKRYLLYIDALASVPAERDTEILEIVRCDPDRVMSEAAIVTYLDRAAQRSASPSQYAHWLEGRGPQFAHLEFATRRANEWQLVKELDAGGSLDEWRLLS